MSSICTFYVTILMDASCNAVFFAGFGKIAQKLILLAQWEQNSGPTVIRTRDLLFTRQAL